MKYKQNQENVQINSLLRTNYFRPKLIKRKCQSIEEYKTKINNNYINNRYNINQKSNKVDIGCQVNINLHHKSINNNNFLKLIPKHKLRKSKSTIGTDTWAAMLSRTSSEGLNRKVNNSKTYQSSIFPNGNLYKDYLEKRMLKRAVFSDHSKKTQITTLPGGIKRNKYDIKDNAYFNKKNNHGFLYRILHDYDLNVDYNNPKPILQGYNINNFPVKQRYYGSYQKGVINHDIFHLDKKDEITFPHKRLFINNSTFKSQINFI